MEILFTWVHLNAIGEVKKFKCVYVEAFFDENTDSYNGLSNKVWSQL